MSMTIPRWVKALLWSVLAPGIVVLLVRAFVGDVYYVDSRSMAPTLHGGPTDGDYVFVEFDRASDDLQRFDLVVLQKPGEPTPLVKRVAGLGGESVQVSAGDLVVGGKLLPPDAPRPPWVLLFDSAREDLGGFFNIAKNAELWSRGARGWTLDTHGKRGVSTELVPRALDSYFDRFGQRIEGRRHAPDLALDLELRVRGEWRGLRLRLTEEGDRFDLVLEPSSVARRATARFERRAAPRPQPQVLVTGEIDFDPTLPHRIVFSNIDNSLRLDLDGKRAVLRHDYEFNTQMWGVESGFQHQLPRAAFGGDALTVEYTRVRVWRDVFWVELGSHGVDQPLVLAPGKLFVLGDNSAESLDSREWGPALAQWLIGRPRAVVWPPSRWRWLTPTDGGG